jgi:transcriptional regulator with GAF, ATPase, and Fis domain
MPESRYFVESAPGRPADAHPARAALDPVLLPLVQTTLDVADGRLARVWLVGPGDQCASCPMRSECGDQTRCLHLIASAGLTTRTDGPWRRYPIGAREVGRVPVTGRPFEAGSGLEALGLADPAWFATHGIRSFSALPLVVAGRAIGVLAVFSGRELDPALRRTLAGLAQLGATALGAIRAWREIANDRNRVAVRSARERKDANAGAAPVAPVNEPAPGAALRTLADLERDAIARVLEHTGGRVSGPRGAAAVLGLKSTTLFSRMKKLGVPRRARTP